MEVTQLAGDSSSPRTSDSWFLIKHVSFGRVAGEGEGIPTAERVAKISKQI